MNYVYTYLTGMSRTATDKIGTLYHAVPVENEPEENWDGVSDWATAACGAKPGKRSNGWSAYRHTAPICEKCIKKVGG